MKMLVNFVLGSRKILNVLLRVRLRFSFSCGLVHNHFDQPQDPVR
jgi:hypothetical protein